MAEQKSWIPKVLVGCGCLTGILLVIAAAVLYFGYERGREYVEEKVDTYDPGSIAESPGDSADSTDSAAAIRDMSPAAIRKELGKPLTRADLQKTEAIFTKLKNSDAHEQYLSSAKSIKELGNKGEKSTVDQLAGMRDVSKGFGALKDLQDEYHRLVKESGGYPEHFGRLVRLGGAAAAAKQTAKDHKLDDPASDEVAKLVAGDVPAVKKEFLKTEAEATALKKAGKADEAQMMMMTLLRPGAIAMARMPTASYETWRSFSVEDRKRVLEPHHGLGQEVPAILFMAANPEALVLTSEADLWK